MLYKFVKLQLLLVIVECLAAVRITVLKKATAVAEARAIAETSTTTTGGCH